MMSANLLAKIEKELRTEAGDFPEVPPRPVVVQSRVTCTCTHLTCTGCHRPDMALFLLDGFAVGCADTWLEVEREWLLASWTVAV